MVLDATNPKLWTRAELLRRLPASLFGAEGEGDGEGEGTQTTGGDGSGTTTTTTQSKEAETFDREYVEKLRQENASRRTAEKELQAQIEAYEEEKREREKAEMTEAERAKAEAEEAKAKAETAEKELINERKRNAVISEASRLKFRDPEDALVYVDLDDIKLNDDGKPHKTSVESAVKKTADDKQYLIEGPGSADGGSRGTNPPADAERQKEIQTDIELRGGVRVPG